MISVVIDGEEAEIQLVRTLSSLVPAAADGVVREVVLAGAGASEGARRVADAAGCVIVEGDQDAALNRTRSPWVLLVRPGTVLEESWAGEALEFMERADRNGETRRAGRFRNSVDAFGALAALRGFLSRFGKPQAMLAPRQALIDRRTLIATPLRARAVSPRKR